MLQSIGFHFTQYVPVKFQCIRGTETLPQSFTTFYITFIKDVSSEVFHFIGDVPALVVGDAFVDIIQQPGQDGRSGSQFFDEAIYRIAQHFGIVQFYIEVGA